ncbi:MAG: bifunctional phosphoribosylaminoimidazolecarboxamide formyltransferase/IMP cyclohydrolase [Armatimonadetes bacterium 55-13]|nr:bifunctional phosphoribosylaminoimidazolecarboxamide formyltransferase/IMP cyclohydrolase [Armatimonadota bacterium]OJU64320.1 MAG: bifunctional phosphoribosylaminoimidazolecarboxamide formyltransferase/IMP cyclohydrolase [Armatimonadetes bacterium 55-13]
MKRALLSVTDKSGVVDFAKGLAAKGFELVSTGGTAKALRDAGLTVKDVSEVTGFPEMMDGRLKTLHPLVHGGLLGDIRLDSHRQAMAEAGIEPITVVCVNLYAFEKTVTGPHEFHEAIESIDIGGPAMIRAAAKNHPNLYVVVDPADYPAVLEKATEDDQELKRRLAAKAFRHTAFYDSMISRYLTEAANENPLSETLSMGYRLIMGFRYGENPHQTGALYADPLAAPGIAQAKQLWGKELSYNNLNDADGAWELVADLPKGACAIIKHGNPCGAAHGQTLGDSYRLARQSDPISAFGGIAAFNTEIDADAANAMTEKGNFLEVVIGTSFTEEAVEIFKNRSGWGQDVRLLAAPLPPEKATLMVKTIRGGAIIQDSDEDPGIEWKVVTKKAPTPEQMAALKFQWSIIPHVKSNAIVVGTENRLLGVGAGQMNRVQSVRLALEQAGEGAQGAVLASDAFFPFPDSIQTAAAAGIAAVVQPGGSKKDADVIAAADELGIAMVLTSVRHFRH